MASKNALPLAVAGLLALWTASAPTVAQDKQKPTIKIPEAGVPQIQTPAQIRFGVRFEF